MTPAAPRADEVPSYFAGYVARVTEPDPVAALAAQIDRTGSVLGGLSEQDALRRYAPEKWSVKEVAGHLADTERIMAYRALRIARGDPTPLPGFDEKAYVPAANFDARPLAALVADLRTIRTATVALFGSLDPGAWVRHGTVSGHPITPRALAYIIVGHERHHLEVLKTRYGVA